jgi:ABC-type branched-subunit amino acid transport system ATPase component
MGKTPIQLTTQPAISLQDVSVGWGSRVVLERLDFAVARGQVSCLVGPGGSGKSTLLRAIEDLCRRSSPTQLTGPAAGGAADTPLWWRGFGHATIDSCVRLRQHGEFRNESVGELLHAPGMTEHESWMPEGRAERAAVQQVLGLPLAAVPDPLRRFLSFVLVACSDAPLLLLDEPLFALAGAWAQVVRAGLSRLADGSRTLVLVTHYLPLARELSDHVTLLVDGEVIESAPTEDFFCHARHARTRQFIKWGG